MRSRERVRGVGAGTAPDVAAAASRGHQAEADLLEALKSFAAGSSRPVHRGTDR